VSDAGTLANVGAKPDYPGIGVPNQTIARPLAPSAARQPVRPRRAAPVVAPFAERPRPAFSPMIDALLTSAMLGR